MNIQGATRLSPTTGALALFGIIAFAALLKETKLIKINTTRIPPTAGP